MIFGELESLTDDVMIGKHLNGNFFQLTGESFMSVKFGEKSGIRLFEFVLRFF